MTSSLFRRFADLDREDLHVFREYLAAAVPRAFDFRHLNLYLLFDQPHSVLEVA